MLDLGAPATAMTTVLEGIGDDRLDAATPCADTTVGQLIAHVLGLSVAFRDAARKVDGPTTSTPPGIAALVLPDEWRPLVGPRLAELAEAWRDPAAWQGMTRAGGVSMPGPVTAIVANNELVLHGWDLAVASGQPFAVAAPNLDASWQFVSQTPDDPRVRQGLFGPVVPVPADAPLLDRLLGGAGRDPNWSARP